MARTRPGGSLTGFEPNLFKGTVSLGRFLLAGTKPGKCSTGSEQNLFQGTVSLGRKEAGRRYLATPQGKAKQETQKKKQVQAEVQCYPAGHGRVEKKVHCQAPSRPATQGEGEIRPAEVPGHPARQGQEERVRAEAPRNPAAQGQSEIISAEVPGHAARQSKADICSEICNRARGETIS